MRYWLTLLLVLPPQFAAAQSLTVPRTLFLTAAAADWTTTAMNRSHGFPEHNPLINWTDNTPTMITVGVAMDLGGLWLWERLTRNHRRLTRVGLFVAAGLRFAVAAQNFYSYQTTPFRPARCDAPIPLRPLC